MKTWFVFAMDEYYPSGGMDDFLGSYETEGLAKNAIEEHKKVDDWTFDFYLVHDISRFL